MGCFSEIPSGAVPVMLTPFADSGEVDYCCIDDMVEFYIAAGVSAIFAVCLSSEMFHLTPKERVSIAARVYDRANGRIAVVAGGDFSGCLEDQVCEIEEMYETGVDAVVVSLSLLPSPHDLADQLIQLSRLTSVPLGIYECPSPEHRLLNAQDLGRVAQTNRFVFMKETSMIMETSSDKICAAKDTALKIFQADLRCTPETLKVGAAGHCGVIANVCPELCALICESSDPEIRDLAYKRIELMHDTMLAHAYPASAKYVLGKRGLRINSTCRVMPRDAFGDEDRRAMDNILAHFDFQRPDAKE